MRQNCHSLCVHQFRAFAVDVALKVFEKYLEQIDIVFEQESIYYQAARMCMDHSYYQIPDSVCHVTCDTDDTVTTHRNAFEVLI